MRKKCNALALCCFVLALVIYVISYILFHYLSPDGGFTTVFQETAAKPFITLLFGIWGVTFQFAGVMSLLIGWIFFPKK